MYILKILVYNMKQIPLISSKSIWDTFYILLQQTTIIYIAITYSE